MFNDVIIERLVIRFPDYNGISSTPGALLFLSLLIVPSLSLGQVPALVALPCLCFLYTISMLLVSLFPFSKEVKYSLQILWDTFFKLK